MGRAWRFAGILLLSACASGPQPPETPPNLLWITVEDMSATLGCWGDAYAHTPNLDKLATESVRYTRAFATAPVCSPARSCLITGMYATSMGTQRLRSAFPIPPHIKGFPSYLRAAGYFCTNNVKTDYNTSEAKRLIRNSWDECSNKAHWRARRPGQPFFSIFNQMVSHQSRSMVWNYEKFKKEVQSLLKPEEIHDPAKAPVPPYYPDTEVVRRTIARTYDCVTAMDKNVGRILRELEEDGLADETIVFFYSDHGTGLPRHKRLLLDSGMHVPLMVRFPPKYRHLAPAEPGETVDRLVSFVDFAPTVLSLLGLEIPKHMQGRAFLGKDAAEPRKYVFGARDRVDEAYDLARSVRGPRYLYVRTYMPHLSYNQPSAYSDMGEIRNEITRLAAEGKLSGPQLAYAGPTRPREELYDTQEDPHQIRNLCDSPKHASVLKKMRGRLRQWIEETRDLGFLPESDAWIRSKGTTPLEIKRYPLERILEAASLVGGGPEALPRQKELLRDEDPAVRAWAAMGAAGPEALDDPSAAVRIEAAGALARRGDVARALPALVRELKNPDPNSVLHAVRMLELMGEAARPARAEVAAAAKRIKDGDLKMFVRFSSQALLKKLDSKSP